MGGGSLSGRQLFAHDLPPKILETFGIDETNERYIAVI